MPATSSSVRRGLALWVGPFCLCGLLTVAGCDEAVDGPDLDPEDEPSEPSLTSDAVPLTGLGRFESASSRELYYPTRIATGGQGQVFVSDVKESAVFGYDHGVQSLLIVGLDKPLGIAWHDGILFVGSHGRGSVEMYSIDNRAYLGSLGEGSGEFEQPNDIAVSPDGSRIYVVDSPTNTVSIYAPTGEQIGSFGGLGSEPGALHFPSSVTTDGSVVAVGDQANHRVQLFTPRGEFIREFGEIMTSDATSTHQLVGKFTRLQGVELANGELFTVDAFHGHVQVFDLTGSSLGYLGRRGACDTCVDLALDVAVGVGGDVLVTDPAHQRWVTLSGDRRATP